MKHGDGFGLYRDDGLGIIKATPRQVENIKKSLCSIFQKYSLKITTEANKKIVNFLDVTLNLNTGKFHPYSKPNNTPPPLIYTTSRAIFQQYHAIFHWLSTNVSLRYHLTKNLSDSHHRHTKLEKSGYEHQLKFKDPLTLQPETRVNATVAKTFYLV